MINFENEAMPELIPDEGVGRISALAQKQVKLEAEILFIKKVIEQKEADLKELQESQLPNAMFELGVSEFKLATGEKISIQKKVIGNIKKENQEAAYKWLEENNLSGLVKKQVNLDFAKDEVDLSEVVSTIQDTFPELDFSATSKKTIHPATLNAFCKEQIESGVTLPEDLFNVIVFNKANIKL